MKGIKLVEYNESYAAKVADMWNKSGEGWFGDDTVRTEESVKESERHSGNINTFLAQEGDEIVGYCSFSEFKQDEGASYIPLLNVRPDYHGKKVGKLLVKRVVEEAIKHKWPRLDLYTWPGNTKAVPLYKKCGFFWERRDDMTHLMNFIPYVLKNELTKDYFDQLDWYEDMKREIKVEKDGIEENGFHYYEYKWEKDDLSLKMQFEKSSRGLRLVETNDYIIKAEIDNQELIFGKNCEVIYYITNKSGKELNIEIQGKDNKNIEFNLVENCTVCDEKIIKGKFYLNKPLSKQNERQTYPSVISTIIVNGKGAEFKLGIDAKYPVEIEAISTKNPHFIDCDGTVYLNIENKFDEDVTLEFCIRDNGVLEAKQEEYSIKLKSKEKLSLPIVYKVKQYGYFKENIEFKVKTGGENIEFSKEIDFAVRGYEGIFYGENEERAIIFNGQYEVSLLKSENTVDMDILDEDNVYSSFIMHPKVGLPYSLELSKSKPEKIEYQKKATSIEMRAIHKLKDAVGLKLHHVLTLNSNGILESYYEVENTQNESTKDEIYVNGSYYSEFVDACIPYENKLIKLTSTENSLGHLEFEKLTERWIFFDNPVVKRGVIFSEMAKVKADRWYFSVEYNLGKIEGKSKLRTGSTIISWNTFSNWKSFRKYALKGKVENELPVAYDIDFKINNGNPFIDKDINVLLDERKTRNNTGNIEIESKNKAIDKLVENVDTSEEKIYNLPIEKDEKIDVLRLRANLNTRSFTREKALFYKGNGQVEEEIYKEYDKSIYKLSNGIINIESCPEYSLGLLTLRYDNQEWLEKVFPKYEPRGGFNPWLGGSTIVPFRLSTASIVKENISAEFIVLNDNYENTWKGIKTSLKVVNDQRYNGLTINQYYLMLPNTPVLCVLNEIVNNTGKFMNEGFQFINGIKYGESLGDGYFSIAHEGKEFISYAAGSVDKEIDANKLCVFTSNYREENMHIYTSGNNGLLVGVADNTINGCFTIYRISIENKKSVVLPTSFMVFSKEMMDKDMLNDLDNIKFDI